jgi:tetratricopeptide (TPR) repeat protein
MRANFPVFDVALLLLASPLAGQPGPASPHDVTTYAVVVAVPGMEKVRPVRGVTYAEGVSGALKMDLYHPDGPASQRPAVVFVNGVGGPLNAWRIYETWARLVAAHGLVGVTYESNPGAPAENLRALTARLGKDAAALGVDPSRLALWSCSGNVRVALPFAMEAAPKGVRAAVFYYGTGEAAKLRTDLPVFWVLAGRDYPGLVEGERAHFARAVKEGAPWTMVNAPELTHAFDALDEGATSRRIVEETVDFLVSHLTPASRTPEPSAARRALTHSFGFELEKAAAAYREIVSADPGDAAAWRQLGRTQLLLKDAMGAATSYEKALALGGGDARTTSTALFNLACAYALTGRRDDALDRLSKAVAAGFGPREFIAEDVDLASLRGDPRFEALLARVPARGGRR